MLALWLYNFSDCFSYIHGPWTPFVAIRMSWFLEFPPRSSKLTPLRPIQQVIRSSALAITGTYSASGYQKISTKAHIRTTNTFIETVNLSGLPSPRAAVRKPQHAPTYLKPDLHWLQSWILPHGRNYQQRETHNISPSLRKVFQSSGSITFSRNTPRNHPMVIYRSAMPNAHSTYPPL